ncbi:tetratricopeptide repeat protein [Streptomyces sp900105245]|uniref:Tetratricopeptide repeat protein n=1 Tax=Streptomyces sp. 900105245 TaxID=3154379 RepID=A0ABV1U520_9ACTN
MKRRSMWAGIAAAVAVSSGVAVWALQSPSAGPTESKAQNTKSAGALLKSAVEHQVHQDLQGADEDYRRVLELDPKNKNAWYGLGVIEQQQGRTANAQANFDKALAIDPHFMSALYSEAFMVRASDPDRAIDLLKRGATADPKAAAIHLQLGQLLAETNRKDEAEDAFRHAVSADHRLLTQVPEEFRDTVSH